MITRIFVPITGTDESKIATEKAIETAVFLNAKVTAIYVLDKESLAKLQRYKIFIEEESSVFGDNLRRDAEKYLEYAKRIASSYHIDIETVLLEGDPFLEIKNFIKKNPAQHKFVMIAKVPNSENFIDSFGSLEKKMLRSGLGIMIAGE
ncbi:Nucleotide-binding universal stress protein, UspA family [Brevinema andersonii]|uniref:Nucleotide-binding universal stress protein, UspA family n=1 Tax=Brevinema andersonii TaxID=34097 RepID=A0A1I1DQB8_BREAD|nr:universal stress protein [Brevinema andersonii]SFB77034.1 Nucleotide-binding universal stress protein, UspA family [Brevinema andersonii]